MARPRRRVDIPATFRGPRVLTLEQLGNRLAMSRSTVLRRLAEHGYFTSYNCRGRFLTIKEVAQFDFRGLWVWNAARFSEHGTLKETARFFIESADRGMAHDELRDLLGVRVQNTLLELVERKLAHREKLGPAFVYVSARKAVRREQVRQRLAFIEENRKARPSARQVIAILVELIGDPEACREELVSRCEKAGVAVSPATVDVVFETYDLDKKRALSRSSTSSRKSSGGPPPR